jgi:hypothetical protein
MAGVDEGRRPARSRGMLLSPFSFFSCSSPSSLAPHLARSREQPCCQREDGGRPWPPAPRRRGRAPPCSKPPASPPLLFSSPSTGGLFYSPKTVRTREVWCPWHGGEGGGATGSPLAGERIPREGECAAVEGFHRGAQSLCPSHRRAAEVRRALDSPCPSAQRAPRQRRQWWRQGEALVGPSPSRPFDLGLGFLHCFSSTQRSIPFLSQTRSTS